MRHRLLPYLLSIVAVAGLLLLPACSFTPGKPATAAGAGPATSPAAASPATGGKVHLTDYTDNDGPTTTVVLAGAVGDYGKGQRVTSGGSAGAQLALALTRGSFRLDITSLDKKFLGVLAKLAVDPTTCSATTAVSAPVPVVAGSGTGSYHGISGTFDLTITLDEVYRPGACAGTGAYLAQSIVTAGSGTVSFR